MNPNQYFDNFAGMKVSQVAHTASCARYGVCQRVGDERLFTTLTDCGNLNTPEADVGLKFHWDEMGSKFSYE